MSSFVFHLPDIGEGVVEGEVVKVLVKEGDRVEEDQVLAEVMTDKAAVQIPSPKRGIIEKVHIKAGEVVPVEAPMFTIGLAAQPVAVQPAHSHANTDEMPTMSVLPAIVVPNEAKAASAAAREDTLRVLATPTTRRIARDLGVDLAKLSGTGKDGRVTKDDVEKAGHAPSQAPTIQAKTPSTLPATPIARAIHPQPTQKTLTSPILEIPLPKPKQAEPMLPEERMPLRGLRKTIAQNMVRSKFTAPHYTYVEEVDVTALTELRNRTRGLAEERGVKLSFLPFIVKSAVAGLKQFPIVNASLDDESNEIVLKKYYHIGIAVSTDQGLMTIVIRDADKKSLFQIAREIEDLSAKAREGKASRDELLGSTFTITSLGKLGGVLATPILNYPEVAIMGVHKISKKPVVKNDQIVIGETMNISHSFDHRVVDGAVGASFVAYMIRYLENPDLLLLEGV